uniref:Uncharacterized protein n=1 Tax=Rhizophora mucronata TaxID=61149 RepID=A0A2P2N8N4_RHIMU
MPLGSTEFPVLKCLIYHVFADVVIYFGARHDTIV